MADDGVIKIHIPVLPQHIDLLEVWEVEAGKLVEYNIERDLQSTDWELSVDLPAGTLVHSRYRTTIGGTVSPMSDWSNETAIVVPEPGLAVGHVACFIMLFFYVKWRRKQ